MSALVKFWCVGVLGFAVQLMAIAVLTTLFHWPWLPATVIAVECAVVHNFLWHERWTWRDRFDRRARTGNGSLLTIWTRFARFNIATGMASIMGNVIVTGLLVGRFHLPVVPANAAAVILISIVNFVSADRWVFAAVVLLAASDASAAPSAGTLDAWTKYVAETEARFEREVSGSAGAARYSPAQRGGEVVSSGRTLDVGDGTISHWRGSVFVRGVTLVEVLNRLQHPGTPPPQEDVVSSKVLARSPDHLRVYMRLVRQAIVTVSYDTEHDMTFERRSPTLATARSVATRIEEVGGSDHGFMWRLNSYWRYEQLETGVLVTLESLMLSRDVPMLIKPIAGRIVPRIARESMVRTLEALRRYLEPRSRPLG